MFSEQFEIKKKSNLLTSWSDYAKKMLRAKHMMTLNEDFIGQSKRTSQIHELK